MKRSTDRILTTHAGSLPRPDDLLTAYRDRPADPATTVRLRSAVAEGVRQQVSAGVDVVNDGEYGKPMTEAGDYGAWGTDVSGRLSGVEQRELTEVAAIL